MARVTRSQGSTRGALPLLTSHPRPGLAPPRPPPQRSLHPLTCMAAAPHAHLGIIDSERPAPGHAHVGGGLHLRHVRCARAGDAEVALPVSRVEAGLGAVWRRRAGAGWVCRSPQSSQGPPPAWWPRAGRVKGSGVSVPPCPSAGPTLTCGSSRADLVESWQPALRPAPPPRPPPRPFLLSPGLLGLPWGQGPV